MPNSTCRLLSNGYKFDNYGNDTLRLRPCCLFDKSIDIGTSTTELHRYRDFLNNIDSYSHAGCNTCNFLNDNQLRKTWRDHGFDIVPADAEVGDASYLELQIDKTCNGGCIICGPDSSSFWQNELKNYIPIKPAFDYLDKILSIIDIQKTKKILFLGGEPFLSNIDEKLLSLIKEPEKVNLQYTTNGSVYPSAKKIASWEKFQSVLINFSIDGIGPRFEYIRYPLKWDSVFGNMQKMREQLPSNVKFKINHTVNILNLYYYDEFDSWKKSNFEQDRFGNLINYTFNPAAGILNPINVTKPLQSLIADRYSPDSKAVNVIKGTELETSDVLNFLQSIDTRRNLNWKEVFPEISNCL